MCLFMWVIEVKRNGFVYLVFTLPPSPFHFCFLSPVAVLLKDDYFVRGAGLPGRFKAEKMEFHWGQSNGSAGSEHSINGRRFPVEVKYSVPTVRFDKCSVRGHEGQARQRSNVFTRTVFKFFPSKGLKGNAGPPSVHTHKCHGTSVLNLWERKDVSLIMGDKTTHLCLRMCSSSRQNPKLHTNAISIKGKENPYSCPYRSALILFGMYSILSETSQAQKSSCSTKAAQQRS